MRLPEPIEEHGFFWLPEDAENQVPGILRISESGDVTLEVICFSDPDFGPYVFKEHRLGDAPEEDIIASIDRIVGIIDGGLITLDDCFYGDPIGHWLGETPTSIIHAHFAFIGYHFGEGEDVTLSRLTFSVEGLDDWLSISGIHMDHVYDGRELGTSIIHFRPPKEIVLNLPDGIELRFTFQAFATGRIFSPITEAGIRQKAYISLTSKRLRPINDFLELAFKLQNFLSFAIDETVSLDSVVGYMTQEKGGYEASTQVYYQSLPYSETKPKIHGRNMLFLYGNVESELEDILDGWLKNYKTSEPAFNLYFTSKSGAHKYLDGNFLSLVQGIETLHRRNSQETPMPEDEFSNLVDAMLRNVPDDKKELMKGRLKYANELSLRNRLREMIKPFEKFFGDNDERRSFIDKVVSTRNYLTHYDSELVSKAASGNDLWMLYTKLEALFQLHFLRLIGIKDESISAIVEGNFALRNKLGIEPLKSSS